MSDVARSPLRKRYGVFTAIGCLIAGLLAGGAGLGPVWLDGLLFDTAIGANAVISPSDADDGKVAVVAVESRSLDSEELAPYPRAFFGPVWASLIQALVVADAKVVAFDLLLPYSANAFQRGFDREFMATLNRERDRVVLARSVRTVPARNYLAALRFDAGALGMAEVSPEGDGVLRRIRTGIKSDDGEVVPSLVGAALARAGAETLPREILLTEFQHPETIPTYALIDVIRCAQSNPEAIADAFRDRVVFVGSTLPEEDRKRPSSRFIPSPKTEAPVDEGCGLRRLAASAADARNVPGVHLHAVAAQAALSGRLVATAGAGWIAIVAGIAAFAGAVAGLGMRPAAAAGAAAAGVTAIWLIETTALAMGTWLQLGIAVLALPAGAVIAYVSGSWSRNAVA